MKLLFLTGKFGMGHYSAAFSLAERVSRVNPEAEIVIRDIFEYAMPYYSDKVYHAFGVMVTHCSGTYNKYYNHMERKGPDLKPVFLPWFLKKIKNLLEEEQPDAVISTLPLCSQIMSWYKAVTGSRMPLITCITDISSHSEWINGATDCYLVPDRMVRTKLTEKGVEETKIYVYGIPVRPEFDYGEERPEETDGKKHILIMGGGLGILPESNEFYEELNDSGHIRVTVITGKNQEIYKKLHGKYENIDVIGYTNEVYRYMQEADVVISKPGGITLFETIHAGTPLLVFEPFLQQEINNTGFIVGRGIGMILEKNPMDCVREISKIVQDDTLLDAMKANVDRLKREYDQTVIGQVLALIEGPEGALCTG
ncbi:MGDG synthase family glycosyltransferase [Hungatella hathewayi]|uniref:MGDG synthase family glycosyltransferase n=1 Tax=Hungatella hathewayi TaxID=154046 RepID=UPI0035676AC8